MHFPAGGLLLRVAAVFVLLLTGHGSAVALTPQLTRPTRATLSALLQHAEVPEVGESSVFIALTNVLGFDAHNGAFEYDLPYPHLPKISVTAQVATPPCALVSAQVRYGPPERIRRLRLQGTYCLVGSAQWESTDQTARPD